jgi:hypothetical protein
MPAVVRASTLNHARHLFPSCLEVVTGERSHVLHAAEAGEGVATDPGLGVGLACLA